ncbi:MAG: glycosyltransferase family 39 protein [bacterium]|nr:glycosyltransferase family 39 protein [bacterium]
MTKWILGLILIVSFIVRIIGLDYGLPQQFVADEFLMVAVSLKMFDEGSLRPYFPDIFYHQPLTAYISSLGIGVYLAWDMLTGKFADLESLKNYYAIHSSELLIVVRFLSVLFGVATVLLLYFIGRDLFNKRVGLLAAFFGAFELLLVQFNHTGRVWGILPFFIALALWANVKLWRNDDVKNYIKAALASVAALLTLLPGILTFIQTIVVKFSWKNKKLWLAVGVVFLGLVVGLYLNPRGLGVLLLRFNIEIPELSQTIFNAPTNPIDHSATDTIWQRIFDPFLTMFGYIPIYLILFFIGLVVLWRKDRKIFWLLTSFPLVYYLFIGPFFAYGWVARTMLPLVIYCLVVAAFVVDRWLDGQWLKANRVAAVFLVLVVSLPSIIMTISFDAKIVKADTRTQAVEWIYENLLENSRIIAYSVSNEVINQNREVLKTMSLVASGDMNTRQRTLLVADDELFPRPYYFAWDLRKTSVDKLPDNFFRDNGFKYYYNVRWDNIGDGHLHEIENLFSNKKLIAQFKPFEGDREFDNNFANNIRNPLRVLLSVERFGPIVEIYEVSFR